jgi:hypothetical protein
MTPEKSSGGIVTVVCAESIDVDASIISAPATAVERRRNRVMAGLFGEGLYLRPDATGAS